MCQPPSGEAVRGLLGPIITADTTIQKVEAVSSLGARRTYQVVLSDGRSLQLVLLRRALWRPLRSEQDMVASEAAAVRWMRETVGHLEPTEQKKPLPRLSPSADSDLSTFLLPLLPVLLRQGQESDRPGSSFAVYDPVKGTPLALLPQPPSPASQRDIDRQLGTLFRQLAHLTSPTGRFGPLAAVIGTRGTPSPPSQMGAAAAVAANMLEGGLWATGGAGTWSMTFHSMLEGVLRDGEDMGIVMGYWTIRKTFRRLRYILDEVTVARLVVVEGGGMGSVLVQEAAQGDSGKGEKEGGEDAPETKDGQDENERGETSKAKQEAETEETETEAAQKETDTRPRLELSGLRDWSSCVFGDPLLATAFSDPQQQPPSTDLLRGFNGKEIEHAPTRTQPIPLDGSIIESVDTAWIRLLLYQVYHAVVRIVSEFYRPRQDSSARELAARKELNEALARLGEVPDDANKKHQRPSGEMSPAKRIKAED
ncbi:hypothetical protein C8A03DRAFT_35141 [Achaetomium macrosporum]|uniref:Aminoglycoside phosphotransferase domain-containing protein n=1 Tax=Achaetomium macrosporum TaxID=79813 RepID=A0AAN7H9U5_9PEZI|nr:hypothetical protein C8A03DRAFT_35141 [Achaetomium macrosporum]